MAYEIILGRHPKDRDKYGLLGTVLLGKHYVKMGTVTTLSQPVYLDLNKAHVVFVAGKRGSGKSYTMGVIAEGISKLPPEMRKKLSVIMLDTMGIYSRVVRFHSEYSQLRHCIDGLPPASPHPSTVRASAVSG